MQTSNATASSFGWDFQRNAALFLMLKDIKVIDSIRVEGAFEDIEITLCDKKKVYSQAKSVENPDNTTNVKKKLREALTTLNNASKQSNIEKLIYITNSPNPFNNTHTMHAFMGATSLSYGELPQSCRYTIDKMIADNGFDLLDTKKLFVYVLPFYGDDLTNRFKHIKEAINTLLNEMDLSDRGYSDELMSLWQNQFFINSTKKELTFSLSKKSVVWPIVVLLTKSEDASFMTDECDEGELEEILRKYRMVIDTQSEMFSLITKVLFDYRECTDVCTNGKKVECFARKYWVNYIQDIPQGGMESSIYKLLLQFIIYRILQKRIVIMKVKKAVELS